MEERLPSNADVSRNGREESPRASRCPVHPGRPSVGICAGCRRPLCLTCAVPVRGALVGPECLSSYVEDAPPVDPAHAVRSGAGDVLAIVGFAIVLVASVLP